jgi:hypothetical protein
MPAAQSNPAIITGLRGRDGFHSSSLEIPPYKAADMVNVELYRTSFARKRNGASNLMSSTTGEAFTGVISAMGRHVAGSSQAAAELWAVDNAATPVVQRLTGGTVWTSPTVNDAFTPAADTVGIVFCSFKGKLFIAGNTAQDRLHVWDPTDAQVRRTGLATPAAPTVANTGAGAYPAVLRYYKVRYVKKSGTTYLLASELSATVSFTPSGGGTAARVTKPAAISEGETHWQLYASADNNLYFQIAETAVGTTTYDDSATPSAYTGEAPPLVGTHTNWTSVKYLLSANDHLLGAGGWETGAMTSRVWWSGVTNQTGIGDDESVIQTTAVSNYADLGENTGSVITGLGGPINDRVLVFKFDETWQLIPTGQDNPFYRPALISPSVGCVRHHSIIMGEDAAGRPCVYWLSAQGPYRYGADGLQFIGEDVSDHFETFNLDAATVSCHGLWHADKKQVWWWIAVIDGASPTIKLVFDARIGKAYEAGRVTDGWVKHDGASASALCSVMFSTTIGASMSIAQKPYAGYSGANGMILKCDDPNAQDEPYSGGFLQYQASVTLPTRHWAGLSKRCLVGCPAVLGDVSGATLTVSLAADYDSGFGLARTGTVTMSALLSGGTRTLKQVESAEFGDSATAIAIKIGDAAAATQSWVIDALVVPWEAKEAVTP